MRSKFRPSPEALSSIEMTRAKPDDAGRVLPKRGEFNRRHLIDADHTEDGRTYNWMLHATKGWRRRRVHGAA